MRVPPGVVLQLPAFFITTYTRDPVEKYLEAAVHLLGVF